MARLARFLVSTTALAAIACNALFGDTAQCSTNEDCASLGSGLVCGVEGTCLNADGTTPTNGPGPSGGDASTGDGGTSTTKDSGTPEKPLTLASITVQPAKVTLAPGEKKQFTALAKDPVGLIIYPPPPITWTVSGGGTISPTGEVTAGATGGTAFKVTATSGAINGVADLSIVIPPIRVGETNTLATDDTMKANFLLAQEITLNRNARLQSVSFFIATAAGKIRFGVYDATGPGNGPGAKRAETPEFTAVTGFQTIPVVTPVNLTAGNYWLAFVADDNALVFRHANNNTGKFTSYDFPYAALPDTYSTTPTAGTDHWSFYATLQP